MTKRGYKFYLRRGIPLFLLVLTALFFFNKINFGVKTLYGSDFILQFYPWKKFVFDHIWSQGSLPLWNPYLLAGTPFVANIQASMFYPMGFFFYFIPPEVAYGLCTILHCILGSIFMYSFMRSIRVSPAGSFFSAIVFSFNGYFMGHLYAGHLTFVQNYIWIPLVFNLLFRFIQTRCYRWAVGGGLVLGVQILGGFPQIAFYTMLGCIAFVSFYSVIEVGRRFYRQALTLWFGVIVLVGLGFCLAAVQILPTMEFTELSTRAGGVSYAMATYESLHPKELLAFLMPDIFGNAVDMTYWRSRNFWHFWESCGYVGIIPLFFVFVRTESGQLHRLRQFFVVLTLLSLFLALGKFNPLYPLIYRLPGFNSFRIPAQIIFLYVFSVAVLTGMGAHGILEGGGWTFNRSFVPFFVLVGILLSLFMIARHIYPFDFFFQLFKNFSEGPVTHANMEQLYERISLSIDKSVLLFFCSFLLVVMQKRRWLSSRIFLILISGILVVDLYLFGGQLIGPHEFTPSPKKQHIVAQLHHDPFEGRVVTVSDLFKSNDGLRYRFPSIMGYDPLILKRYVYYVLASQGYPPDDHVVNLGFMSTPNKKLLKLLNVKQMVMGEKVERLDCDVPYAYVVRKTGTKKLNEILPFMQSDEFDPRSTVVFEPESAVDAVTVNENEPFHTSCSVLSYGNESLTIKASASGDGYLVLSEIFYPGWQATVDGKKVPVLCGNYLFRVIPLARGDHEVHLSFVSWPFRMGSAISLLTLVVSLGFVIGRRKKVSPVEER